MIGAKGRLIAFGNVVKGRGFAGQRRKAGAIAAAAVDGIAPDFGDCGDIGRTALAPLNLDRDNAHGHELGQQLNGVEAGWLLEGMKQLAIDPVASLAQGWVTGLFTFGEAIDDDTVEARLKDVTVFPPVDKARW